MINVKRHHKNENDLCRFFYEYNLAVLTGSVLFNMLIDRIILPLYPLRKKIGTSVCRKHLFNAELNG